MLCSNCNSAFHKSCADRANCCSEREISCNVNTEETDDSINLTLRLENSRLSAENDHLTSRNQELQVKLLTLEQKVNLLEAELSEKQHHGISVSMTELRTIFTTKDEMNRQFGKLLDGIHKLKSQIMNSNQNIKSDEKSYSAVLARQKNINIANKEIRHKSSLKSSQEVIDMPIICNDNTSIPNITACTTDILHPQIGNPSRATPNDNTSTLISAQKNLMNHYINLDNHAPQGDLNDDFQKVFYPKNKTRTVGAPSANHTTTKKGAKEAS